MREKKQKIAVLLSRNYSQERERGEKGRKKVKEIRVCLF